MNVWDKIRIKRKIRKLCCEMRARMNEKDVVESVGTIKGALRFLPGDKKEGLIDVCYKAVKRCKME